MSSSNKLNFVRVASTLLILIHARTLMPLAPLVPQWKWASLGTSYDDSPDINETLPENSSLNFDSISTTTLLYPQMSLKLTILSAVYATTDILVSLIAGQFGDQFGFDIAILVGLVSAFALIVLLVFSGNFLSVLVAHCLQGVSLAFILPIGLARILKVFPAEHKYNSIAVALTQICMSFSIFGNIFSGFLIEYFGQRGCFLAMIPFNIALIVITVLQFRLESEHSSSNTVESEHSSNNPQHEDNASSEHEDNADFPFAAASPKHNIQSVSLRDILSDYQVFIVAGGFTVCFLHKSALEPTIGFWLAYEFDAGSDITGLIWGVGGLIIIPANVIGAWFARFYPRWMWLYTLVHLVTCVFPIAYLPYATSPILAALALVCYLYCATSARYSLTIILSSLAEIKYPNAYGRVMAVANFGITMPYLIGPLFAVPLINHIGFKQTCLYIGAFYVVYPGLMVFLRDITADNEDEDEMDFFLSSSSSSHK